MTVEQTQSNTWRVVVPPSDAPAAEPLLAGLFQAFEQALGWRLAYTTEPAQNQKNLMWSAPETPGVGASLRLIKVHSDQRPDDFPRPVGLRRAVALAESLGELFEELTALRAGLADSEAQLAADVPVVVRPETNTKSAERLSAVLRSGAEGVGCQAAGLYVLDPGTTSLKLRACWGLPERRLTLPPRPLRGALADLEALLGHAVVLSEPGMFSYWQAPETCAAAVCVPVSSSTMPLGTMWVYSQLPRDFTDEQTNLLETVAGRLAAELEREVLVTEAGQSRQQRQQWEECQERIAETQTPAAPSLENWSVAGRVFDERSSGRSFVDWFAAPQERQGLVLGAAVEPSWSGALAAAQLRSAMRAQSPVLERASQGLVCAHQTLAAVSAGSDGVNAFCGLIDRDREYLRFSAAGATRVWLANEDGCRIVGEPSAPLGTTGTLSSVEFRRRLDPGATCVACTLAGVDPTVEAWAQLDQELGLSLPRDSQRSADQWIDMAEDSIRRLLPDADGALLVVRRR